MGDPKGFLKIKRETSSYRPVCERVHDYKDVVVQRSDELSRDQGARCMDCGTPFCHWGCPAANYIPEWNEYLFRGQWQKAWELLQATNNLPEITGRICPALCEYACVLGVNDDPVTCRENELAIAEHAFKHGLVKARRPKNRTGKNVAVIGSGPAGLSCADQLNQAGHMVTVFEKHNKAGGILRYGIPDFKLDKKIIDRRIALLKKEGIVFVTGTNVGVDLPAKDVLKNFDAVCLAGGSRVPRDIAIEGRNLSGIHFAMDYLMMSNKRVSGEKFTGPIIDAKGKSVVVIGGGDTGADCVGTANRQGAACVVQIEVMPQPPECRPAYTPWPRYPMLLKTTTSHEEGSNRYWSILTKRFTGRDGKVEKIHCVKVDFSEKDAKGCALMKEVPGSAFEIEADLVILAVGFIHPEHTGLVTDLGVALDERKNVKTDSSSMTSVNKVFSAGDMHRGQSLVVWAISEGRRAAHGIDSFLMGSSDLPNF